MSDKTGLAVAAAVGVASLALGFLVHQINKEEEEEKNRKQNVSSGAMKSLSISKEQAERHWQQVIEDYMTNGSFRRSTFNKELLRARGLPPASRPLLWPMICGSGKRRQTQPTLYNDILTSHVNETSSASEDVEKDLRRTFPEERYFQTEEGLGALRRVLVAFSWHHPEIGYCQAMNYVCGAILLSGCSEEECFWLLDTIVVELLPPDFYANSLHGLKKELAVLRELVATELPRIHNHFLATRFLDCFLYEGRKSLFRTSLGLLKLHERQILNTREMGEAFVLCRDLPSSSVVNAFEDLFQPHLDLGEISASRIAKLAEKAVPIE